MSTKPHVNPFRVGTEIRDPANFVGRKGILKKISSALLDLQNVSLHGERRTGKTSLLLYLAHSDTISKLGLSSTHVPVYFNFQGFAEADASRVWQAIADAIANHIKHRIPNGQTKSDQFLATVAQFSQAPEMFATSLGQVMTHLGGADLKIHLLFDEFDQTARNPNLGDLFYDALRSLPTRAGNISYVIATRTGLAALQPKYDKVSSPLFNIFTALTLWPFEEDEVHELISDYFDQSGLDVSLAEKLYAQSLFLHKVTGYHPYFLQTLCYHLCARLGKPDWPLGQTQKEALEDFEKDSDPHFDYYWKVSSKEEQELMAKLATRQPIRWNLLGYGAASLKDRCLIVETEHRSGWWQLFSSVFVEWITNKLAKVNPQKADQLFGFGEEKSSHKDWESAIHYFRDALEKNPGHCRAQLYLGRALLEQEQIEEAVSELERAYKLDQEEAHLSFVRALVAQAKARQQAGDEDGALNACERALQISSDEQQAREMRTAIWIRRRDTALERNELDKALDAHQQADIKPGREAIDFFQHVLDKDPRHSLALLRIGQVLLELDRINQAIVKLEQAYKLDQEDARLPLARALTAQAQTAREAGDWLTVLDFCTQVMQIDRTYPDTPEMMAEAMAELRREDAEEGTPGIDKRQLGKVLSAAENHVRLLGVIALDADWQVLAKKWAAQLKSNSDFEITVLCESDNLLFSKAFTCDTDAVENRQSFRALQFTRDRAIIDFPELLSEAGIFEKKVKIEIMHLPIPLSVIQVDDVIFANLWLHEATNSFEKITQHHPWHSLIEKYVSTYLDPAYGRKYSCDPRDEVLTLFDHKRIPRGIYPRHSFYDTDYSQLVVWALVFDRQGRLLIHRRSDNAKDNQGMWDKSVGGHYDLADVDTSRAVPREVIEELFRDELKASKADFTVQDILDRDMIYLGEWRPDQRRQLPFNEIRAFSHEWAFFRLRESQHLYSPRTLPAGGLRRLRVIADVFLFIANSQLTEESLGDLKNSVFKLIELAELKDAMDKAIRSDEVPGFDDNKPVPGFTPDLTNIMTGELRDTLEQFSQYIKSYIESPK